MITDGKEGAMQYAYQDPDENKTILFSTLDGALKYYEKVVLRKEKHVNIDVLVCYQKVQVGVINIDKLRAEISRRAGSGHPRQY